MRSEGQAKHCECALYTSPCAESLYALRSLLSEIRTSHGASRTGNARRMRLDHWTPSEASLNAFSGFCPGVLCSGQTLQLASLHSTTVLTRGQCRTVPRSLQLPESSSLSCNRDRRLSRLTTLDWQNRRCTDCDIGTRSEDYRRRFQA
jgi:hypothetical protein